MNTIIKLQEMTGGLRFGHIYVCGASTCKGKSALAFKTCSEKLDKVESKDLTKITKE